MIKVRSPRCTRTKAEGKEYWARQDPITGSRLSKSVFGGGGGGGRVSEISKRTRGVAGGILKTTSMHV